MKNKQINTQQVKNTLLSYIKKERNYNSVLSLKVLNYIAQSPTILYEFYHYVSKGKFIDDQVKYYGFTAEKIFEETNLSLVTSFMFMSYLHTKPEMALIDARKKLYKHNYNKNRILNAREA